MTWLEAYGTYAKKGPYNNVAMGGSPNTTIHNLDLSQAKSKNYGKGVQFTPNGNNIKIEISLVGYSITDQLSAILNSYYVRGNFTYDWYLDIYVSTDNGNSYQDFNKNILLAQHNASQNLAYSSGWELSTILYSNSFNFPENFTHIKIEVRGDEPAQRHQNIYTREQVYIDIPKTYKPMAIFRNNVFKSLNVATGFIQIFSQTWKDISNEYKNNVGKINIGHNQIYKENNFKQQNEIGEK